MISVFTHGLCCMMFLTFSDNYRFYCLFSLLLFTIAFHFVCLPLPFMFTSVRPMRCCCLTRSLQRKRLVREAQLPKYFLMTSSSQKCGQESERCLSCHHRFVLNTQSAVGGIAVGTMRYTHSISMEKQNVCCLYNQIIPSSKLSLYVIRWQLSNQRYQFKPVCTVGLSPQIVSFNIFVYVTSLSS